MTGFEAAITLAKAANAKCDADMALRRAVKRRDDAVKELVRANEVCRECDAAYADAARAAGVPTRPGLHDCSALACDCGGASE